jgi:hypothetical protein
MARQSSSAGTERERVLATVARLVVAADGDTLYRDVYLRRAGEMLSPIITEASYESAVANREQLRRLHGQARGAIARQDWEQVRELGTRVADLQRALDAEQAAVAAGESVYGAPVVVLDPLSPGLTSFSTRWSDAAQASADVTKALAELARDDGPARELYATRQKAIQAISLPSVATAGGTTQTVSAANVEQQAINALERGDGEALQSLADAMLGSRAAAGRPAADQGVPFTRAAIAAPDVLGEPLPDACLPRATTLGLERVEVKLASSAASTTIAEFVARFALGASAAGRDRASEGVARVTLAAEEIAIPSDLAAVFAETIGLFALHLFVNSAGLRYVPLPVPREMLLIEAHADGDETVTPLLRELGFERRRGLSRDDVETALRKNGARIVAEHLRLDPLAFRIVCMPADVFVRTGGERGWGKRPEWTHFDGYQVGKGGRLRALVGGNAKFGGLFDLASISRDDARDNTVVRFAVVRRERLGVRIG